MAGVVQDGDVQLAEAEAVAGVQELRLAVDAALVRGVAVDGQAGPAPQELGIAPGVVVMVVGVENGDQLHAAAVHLGDDRGGVGGVHHAGAIGGRADHQIGVIVAATGNGGDFHRCSTQTGIAGRQPAGAAPRRRRTRAAPDGAGLSWHFHDRRTHMRPATTNFAQPKIPVPNLQIFAISGKFKTGAVWQGLFQRSPGRQSG